MRHITLWLRLKVRKRFWLQCWKCSVIPKDQGQGQSGMSIYWPVLRVDYTRHRCLGGSRTLDTHLYKPDSYPFDLIGPITIIWQALPQRSTEKSASNVKSSTLEENTHEKKPPDMLPASGQMTNRTVWLRFHPSVHLEVFETLEEAASRTLVKYKTNSGSQEVTMEVADLRRHVNVFEIMGPKSNQVIKGALSPVASENREEFLKVSF